MASSEEEKEVRRPAKKPKAAAPKPAHAAAKATAPKAAPKAAAPKAAPKVTGSERLQRPRRLCPTALMRIRSVAATASSLPQIA